MKRRARRHGRMVDLAACGADATAGDAVGRPDEGLLRAILALAGV